MASFRIAKWLFCRFPAPAELSVLFSAAKADTCHSLQAPGGYLSLRYGEVFPNARLAFPYLQPVLAKVGEHSFRRASLDQLNSRHGRPVRFYFSAFIRNFPPPLLVVIILMQNFSTTALLFWWFLQSPL